MGIEGAKSCKEVGELSARGHGVLFFCLNKIFSKDLYKFLASRGYSVILFGALMCTLGVKLFHSFRTGLFVEYGGWIAADVGILLFLELLLLLVCYRWPRRSVIRLSTIIAAVVCTWSVMNAAWIIRNGTQILPAVLLPLFRDPFNALMMVGVNLSKMPIAAIILLGPSAVALAFFFWVLAKPELPKSRGRGFGYRVLFSIVLIVVSLFAQVVVGKDSTKFLASEELSYNCHLRAVTNLFFSHTNGSEKVDFSRLDKTLPMYSDVSFPFSGLDAKGERNVIIVVLEGIQYKYTSLWDEAEGLTPYLAKAAGEGLTFSDMRCTVTHTTKALFSLLTGRYPSVSQDIAEAVPAVEPYASLVTILKGQLGYRAAFFQSAKGDFECRPGLVSNLGFDTFWAREDLGDPNAFVGYLGCDEFSMVKPIMDWIEADEKPFLLTVLCSVTHDPYEVPEWFDKPKKEPLERYKQAISYTDAFLAHLDGEFERLGIQDSTVFCVVGDHGEAFGEHGLLGHERIGFEEVLQVPWVIRAPGLIEAGQNIQMPVSSVDLTPTVLGILNFQTSLGDFDGANVLSSEPGARGVYFSGWLEQSPLGFIMGDQKYIYNPRNEMIYVYDLLNDPYEKIRKSLSVAEEKAIQKRILLWRRNSIFRVEQDGIGEKALYKNWSCEWAKRIAKASYVKGAKRSR
jgi:phosphoglycerol transferase MdoB-like AlkP superfamily enzyme